MRFIRKYIFPESPLLLIHIPLELLVEPQVKPSSASGALCLLLPKILFGVRARWPIGNKIEGASFCTNFGNLLCTICISFPVRHPVQHLVFLVNSISKIPESSLPCDSYPT